MSQTQKDSFLKLAKGSWQYQILKDLLSNSTITNPLKSLKGKARSYSSKYQTSFFALLLRIEKAGYSITIKSGPMGGQWGSTYTLSVQSQK